MNKKGAIEALTKMLVPILVIIMVLVIAFLINAEVQDQIVDIDGITDETNNSQLTVGYNATVTTAEALDDIPGWLPIIIVTVIGAALIGLVGLIRRR